MIEVKVTAPTAPELSALVKSLAAQFGVSLPTAQAEMVAEVEGEKVVEEVKTEVVKEKKTKKEKPTASPIEAAEKATGKTIAQEGTEAHEALEKTMTETASLTKQSIADACQKVSAAKNLDAAKAILAQFKNEKGEACRRISDVLEADYAAFVSKCEEAVK